MATGVICPSPFIQSFNNAGAFNVGGNILTQVSGVNTATYQDVGLTIPLPNPIPINSRGEVSNVAGLSQQLFLTPNIVYVFTYFDKNGNQIDQASYVNGVQVVQTQASIGALLYPQTTAETAAAVTPSNFGYPEGDIRRYGALTAAGNNAVAINAALAVSAAGGNAAFIPGGTWAYTATITASGSSSMYGVGEASILAPNACDGLSFGIQGTYAGSRFMRDFFISGTGTGTNNGIIVNFTAASGNKVTGMLFSNVTVQNFGQGVFLRGLWTSVFRDCFLYNNYQGYLFHGQNVQVAIVGGICQKGAITGAGTQLAVSIDSVAGESSQSIYFGENFNLYGYANGISMGPAFDISVIGCSFNFLTQYGIVVAAVTGGLTISGNFFQTNNAAFATGAIQLADLGSPVNDKVVIDSNHCECNAANAGSIGIYVGTNNQSVTVINNTVGQATTGWNIGISVGNAQNASVTKNTIYATTTAVQLLSFSGNAEVGPNTVQNGTPLVLSGGTPAGLSYFASGQFTMALTGMTAGLNATMNWAASGKLVTVQVVSAGATGTSNATTMTGTGLPAYLQPNSTQNTMARVVDNGVTTYGDVQITVGGLFTFFKDASNTAFTAAGTKGINQTPIVYILG